jgi:hypothetical protein
MTLPPRIGARGGGLLRSSRVFPPQTIGLELSTKKTVAGLGRCTDLRKEVDVPCYKSHWVG